MTEEPKQFEDYERDPFPKPRTYPSRWDFSGLYGGSKRARSNGNLPAPKMETFPRTSTIPGKWDVSSMHKP